MDTLFAAFAWAVGLGLGAGLAPGPLSALVIGETLRHGGAAGVRVALSPLLSDLPVILVALGAVGTRPRGDPALRLLASAGAVYLLLLAAQTWRAEAPAAVATGPAHGALRRGALVNLLNPHPWLFWLTVGAPYLLGAGSAATSRVVVFLAGFYLALVGAKMALALVTARLRARLPERGYRVVMRVLATVLVLFALRLLGGAAVRA